jgi:Flp pilus assembly protein TadG
VIRALRTAHRAEGAQSLVEFALVLPVLLLLILGLLDLGRAVSQENTLAFAAREATRYAIVHGSNAASPIPYCVSCSDASVTDVVNRNAIGVPNVTVVIGYPDGNNDRNSRVSVDATAPFVPLPSQYLLNGALTVTLRGGSMLVIQR